MEAVENEKSGREDRDTPTKQDTDEVKQDAEIPEVCKFFLRGKCHFGDRCRQSHSDTPRNQNLQMEVKGEKNHKVRRKSEKAEKVKSEEMNGSKKKPRMRTADDVISRILWDSSVDPADFIVGHLDRFLGVLERPFSDFSWDTQVCDCDYSEEMAIPRHRIQYFSFKGQRVWDRDSRTDHVFGSTGQTVMPPFDKEDQLQENMMINTVPEQELNESNEDIKQEDSAVHSVIDVVEEVAGSDVEDTINCPADGSVLQENENVGIEQPMEELAVSPPVEHTEIQEEWKDSWENDEKDEEESAKLQPAPTAPQEPCPGRKPRKPTHFVCIRVDSPAALQAYQRVQRKVLSHLPQSEPFWVKPETLHVTLCLLVLESPAEVFEACELLRSVIDNLYKPPISLFFTPRLKHFNGKVLHVPPQPLSDIQTLNTPLQEAFKQKGWLHRHSRHPNYHLTLAKVEGVEAERMFEEVGVIKLAKDINFGKLVVNKLYLCVNNSPKTASGFYETVCAVQMPTF